MAENIIIQSLSVSDYDVLTYFRKYMKMTAYDSVLKIKLCTAASFPASQRVEIFISQLFVPVTGSCKSKCMMYSDNSVWSGQQSFNEIVFY